MTSLHGLPNATTLDWACGIQFCGRIVSHHHLKLWSVPPIWLSDLGITSFQGDWSATFAAVECGERFGQNGGSKALGRTSSPSVHFADEVQSSLWARRFLADV